MSARGSRIETDFDGKQWDEVRISDLREWHEMFGTCKLCARRVSLPRYVLVKQCGQHAKLVDVQTRLKCTSCKNDVANEIEVERMPRD